MQGRQGAERSSGWRQRVARQARWALKGQNTEKSNDFTGLNPDFTGVNPDFTWENDISWDVMGKTVWEI